ncbi:Site-specific recombinase XerD [Chryseobacterium sp. RU37D]|uniref:tyrosine-type recombinase/integrase n=1 Tax=Chryseobacterium sp. RU37D TaxID=1907397 RepID=UPI0009563368|nr:tyrosine-type recombinase/integrase [Chryseobacterium sp. RU37D]SIQ65541.1 Site-specific recombinase XerD [Chryseobacterium sp. RU37D]
MATIRYILKSTKNPSSLYIRFREGRKIDLVTATGFQIDPKHWSHARESMKNIVDQNPILNSFDPENKPRYDKLNKNLVKLKAFVIESYNNAQIDGELIDKKWLEEIIIKCFNRPVNAGEDYKVFFVPYIKKVIEEAPTRIRKKTNKPVSIETIKAYKATLTKILDFEKHVGRKLKYKDLNLIFHRDFMNFLNVEQALDLKTVGNYIKNVKAMARQALLEGLPVHKEINHPEFFRTSSKTKAIYLNEEEIEKIFRHDFSFNERLNRVRDLLIVGLWTGQRIKDFKNIKAKNVKDGFIEITTSKTGSEVVIPIHPHIVEVMKRWGGDFPPALSDQKFNEYVKEVGNQVGLTYLVQGSKINSETKRKEEGEFPKYELISSHICRRSFATNHYGKLATQTIMAITGHQTEKEFMGYIQTTPKEHAEKMRDLWLRQAEQNGYEEVKLKIVP